MICPVWYNITEVRPKKSGFYMGRFTGHVSFGIFYYYKPLDYILEIEEGCDYYYGVKDSLPLMNIFPVKDAYVVNTLFWADMPKLFKYEVLNSDNGTIEVCI